MRADEIAAIQAAYREIDVVTAKWRALSATCDHLTPEGSANLDSLGACRACYLKCGALGIDPVARAAARSIKPQSDSQANALASEPTSKYPERLDLAFPGNIRAEVTREALTLRVEALLVDHPRNGRYAVRIDEASFKRIADAIPAHLALAEFFARADPEEASGFLANLASEMQRAGAEQVRLEIGSKVRQVMSALYLRPR